MLEYVIRTDKPCYYQFANRYHNYWNAIINELQHCSWHMLKTEKKYVMLTKTKGRHEKRHFTIFCFFYSRWEAVKSCNKRLLTMFDRFNPHRFVIKTLKTYSLHGFAWLKFCFWLPEGFLNFEELKVANLTWCHTNTNLKIPVFSVLWK